MPLWSNDTTFHALSVFADKDIAESLQTDLEDRLVCHLSDMGRLCVELLGTKQMSDCLVVNLHIPVIHDILPYREALSVVMLHTFLVCAPFSKLELRRLHHKVGNDTTKEADKVICFVLTDLGEIVCVTNLLDQLGNLFFREYFTKSSHATNDVNSALDSRNILLIPKNDVVGRNTVVTILLDIDAVNIRYQVKAKILVFNVYAHTRHERIMEARLILFYSLLMLTCHKDLVNLREIGYFRMVYRINHIASSKQKPC